MNGIPPDLPVDRFVGYECNQIAIGRFQIQFHFAGMGSISAESHWEVKSSTGEVIDSAVDHDKRDSYRIHRIIDLSVVAFRVDSPKSFTLFFESNDTLTVFDGSEHYESFSLNFENGESVFV